MFVPISRFIYSPGLLPCFAFCLCICLYIFLCLCSCLSVYLLAFSYVSLFASRYDWLLYSLFLSAYLFDSVCLFIYTLMCLIACLAFFFLQPNLPQSKPSRMKVAKISERKGIKGLVWTPEVVYVLFLNPFTSFSF